MPGEKNSVSSSPVKTLPSPQNNNESPKLPENIKLIRERKKATGQSSAEDEEILYRHWVESEEEKARRETGGYKTKLNNFLLERSEDPEFVEIAAIKRLGVGGRFSNVANATEDRAWRLTSRPDGPANQKIIRAQQDEVERRKKEFESTMTARELWYYNRKMTYGDVKSNDGDEQGGSRKTKEGFLTAAERAMNDKAEEKEVVKTLIAEGQYKELHQRKCPTVKQNKRALRRWNKSHLPDWDSADGFPFVKNLDVRTAGANKAGRDNHKGLIKEKKRAETHEYLLTENEIENAYTEFTVAERCDRAERFLQEELAKKEAEERARMQKLEKRANKRLLKMFGRGSIMSMSSLVSSVVEDRRLPSVEAADSAVELSKVIGASSPSVVTAPDANVSPAAQEKPKTSSKSLVWRLLSLDCASGTRQPQALGTTEVAVPVAEQPVSKVRSKSRVELVEPVTAVEPDKTAAIGGLDVRVSTANLAVPSRPASRANRYDDGLDGPRPKTSQQTRRPKSRAGQGGGSLKQAEGDLPPRPKTSQSNRPKSRANRHDDFDDPPRPQTSQQSRRPKTSAGEGAANELEGADDVGEGGPGQSKVMKQATRPSMSTTLQPLMNETAEAIADIGNASRTILRPSTSPVKRLQYRVTAVDDLDGDSSLVSGWNEITVNRPVTSPAKVRAVNTAYEEGSGTTVTVAHRPAKREKKNVQIAVVHTEQSVSGAVWDGTVNLIDQIIDMTKPSPEVFEVNPEAVKKFTGQLDPDPPKKKKARKPQEFKWMDSKMDDRMLEAYLFARKTKKAAQAASKGFFKRLKRRFFRPKQEEDFCFFAQDLTGAAKTGDYELLLDALEHAKSNLLPDDVDGTNESALYAALLRCMKGIDSDDLESGYQKLTRREKVKLAKEKRKKKGRLGWAIKILLRRGADINFIKPEELGDGLTAAHVAAEYDEVELLRWMIEKGANPLTGSSLYQRTPLMMAATHGHKDVTLLLLRHGALRHINDVDKFGSTALHYAAMKADVAYAKLLVNCGADALVRNNLARTAAEEAQQRGRPEMFAMLSLVKDDKGKSDVGPRIDFLVDMAGLDKGVTAGVSASSNSIAGRRAADKVKGAIATAAGSDVLAVNAERATAVSGGLSSVPAVVKRLSFMPEGASKAKPVVHTLTAESLET